MPQELSDKGPDPSIHGPYGAIRIIQGTTAAPPATATRAPAFLDNEGTRHLNGADLGAVAQLGERCNRTAEVRSSILLGSTN